MIQKVGLHGLHILWFLFLYIIDIQNFMFIFHRKVGLQCKPTFRHLKGPEMTDIYL